MKRIIIDFIPHSKQRYNTCGDWQFLHWDINQDRLIGEGEDVLVVKVSQTPDWRSSALVAVHELIEALLCKHAGIPTEQVDQFDLNWKPHAIRNEFTGDPINLEEPGDDPEAPYHSEHLYATDVEIDLCSRLELQWQQHELNLGSLSTSND